MFILVVLFGLFLSNTVYSAISISTYVIDGVFNNREVVISNRSPIFSWEYEGVVNSFTVEASTSEEKPFTTKTWSTLSSTNSINTTNLGSGKFRTFIDYGGSALQPGSTYYWNLVLFDVSGSSVEASPVGSFFTTTSNVELPTTPYDLRVDLNNPFNPQNGQLTKFRYMVTDTNRKVKVRIYSLTGKFIKAVGEEHLALLKREYTATWDGKDANGDIVPTGIYLVNINAGDVKGITRRIVVINK